jgi:hypothetical protein
MKTFIKGPLSTNARNLMRDLGYGEHLGREGQLSYTKSARGDRFPRFHAYVEDRDGGVQINFHLDQKEGGGIGGHLHGGEYEGPLLEEEMQRIKASAESTKQTKPPAATPTPAKKKGFWG